MSDIYWSGLAGDGDLSNVNNYEPQQLPVANDNLYFGGLGVDTGAVSKGFMALQSVNLLNVRWYSSFQGNYGLGPQGSFTVSNATWASSVITFTTSAAHGYAVGDAVIVSGVTPSGYNGTYAVTGVTSTTFTVANAVNPGAFTAAGTCIRKNCPIFGAAVARVGDVNLSGTSGTGAPRLVHDFGTSNVFLQVVGTYNGTGTDASLEPARFLMSSSSAVASFMGGHCGIATNTPLDATTVGTINVAANAQVDIGVKTSYAALNNNGGTVIDFSSAGTHTINNWGGTLTLNALVAMGIVTVRGGTVYCNVRPTSGNCITTLNLYGGTIDFSQNPQAFQLGAVNLRDGNFITAYNGQLSNTPTWAMDLTDKVSFNVSRS